MDLAQAHVKALSAMKSDAVKGVAFNLGNGEGFSVLDVIDAVEKVTGTRPGTEPAPRRPGDPASLVASSGLARERLGWVPDYPDLDSIVGSAWRWHQAHPSGYASER